MITVRRFRVKLGPPPTAGTSASASGSTEVDTVPESLGRDSVVGFNWDSFEIVGLIASFFYNFFFFELSGIQLNGNILTLLNIFKLQFNGQIEIFYLLTTENFEFTTLNMLCARTYSQIDGSS